MRWRRHRRDPLCLFAALLALLVTWGGLSGQWSYGRLFSHLSLLLQVALADALAGVEARLALRERWRVARHALAPVVAALLIVASWPVVRSVLDECAPGDRRWLSFLDTRVGREEVVMTDADLVMRAATELKPQFVLLDIGLPGPNGFDVARSLRALPELRDSVLVAVSGYGQRDYVRRAREAGFSHYLVKPVNVELLESLLAGRAPPTL